MSHNATAVRPGCTAGFDGDLSRGSGQAEEGAESEGYEAVYPCDDDSDGPPVVRRMLCAVRLTPASEGA